MVTLVRSALVLLLVSNAAAAAPLATLAKDVDGDGSADKIELDASGELRIESKRSGGKIATPVRGSAKLVAAHARNVPTVLVLTDSEGFVYQRIGGAWKQATKIAIGGVGLDADYSVALDVTDDGVYRYQTRPDFRRCDGKPTYLFAERFDGGKFQAVSTLPTFMPANVPAVRARAEERTLQSPFNYKARFSSYQVGAPDAGALAKPVELDDGNAATLWREELPGPGEGQFFTYVPRMPNAKAKQIRFVPAKAKGALRPTRLGVVSAQGAWHVDLPETGVKDPVYVADLPVALDGCVTIVIESASGGNGATTIAELQVWSDNESGPDSTILLTNVVAAGADGARAAVQELARQRAAGVVAIDTALATQKEAGPRGRLVRALLENPDPSKAPVLARVANEGTLDEKDLALVVKALEGSGQGQVLHDLAAREQVALDVRVAAVQALEPSVPAELDLLVTLAGRGPRELRQAVIEVLTDVPAATLAPIANAQGTPAAAGDLWRAITRGAHARKKDARELAAARDALTAALPKAADYERRYRIVDGIAAVGDAAALRTLAETFKQWPADAETAAIKQVAARSIAVNPRPDAFELINAFVVDADPGVRLAALSAIASATAGPAGSWHGPIGPQEIDRVVQTRLYTDTWPEVRRYAAQVLGGRCSRPGPAAALADSLSRDPDLGVRANALAALVECKAPSAPEIIAKLWDNGKAPIEIRQSAVDLTVALGDMNLGKKLVGKFTRWRKEALDSEQALGLSQRAAFAIGRLRAPGAGEALEDALDDSAFPEIVAAASAGLGLLGPACPASAKPKLKQLAQSDEPQVATAAARAYELCGK